MRLKQVQVKPSRTAEKETPDTSTPVNLEKPALTDDVDAILDEIDEVLEVEAEAFVRNYIQRGGQ